MDFFTSYNGTNINQLARLCADGSLCATFNPRIGVKYVVEFIALQPDGKVLIGGQFTSYNGIGRNRIARIHVSAVLPSLVTDSIGSISSQNTVAYAQITSNGDASVTARGFCYNTSAKTGLADSMVYVGSGLGSFSATLSNLMPNTTYYDRSYAANNLGTACGNQLSFNTQGLSLNNPNSVKTQAYPNPTTDMVFVESSTNCQIKVLDLQGRILQSLTAQLPITSLNISEYAKGTYLIEVVHQGRLSRQKVVKH